MNEDFETMKKRVLAKDKTQMAIELYLEDCSDALVASATELDKLTHAEPLDQTEVIRAAVAHGACWDHWRNVLDEWLASRRLQAEHAREAGE
ncbi:MAG: hypothetical protein ABSB35_35830 [Bryobacteraceae bacterium]